MRDLILSLCFSFVFLNSFGQITQTHYKASLSDNPPTSFLQLRLSNDSIRANDILNEQLVDMVQVTERDTMVPTWYTTHQGYFLNWFIRLLGYRWDAVDRKRYKFVGTNKNLSGIENKDHLTEHDINYNLLPHLKKYKDLMYMGTLEQLKRKRKCKDCDTNQPPYSYPTESTLHKYRMHCELTPPKKLREKLNTYFFPCLAGSDLEKHDNFCDIHSTMGMYGVYVLDCNHSCHVEIHPYEWLWWMDLRPKGGSEIDPKNWMIGFMKESSNRFITWTRAPRVGSAKIPFIFKTSERGSYVKVNHLVTGTFLPKGIHRLKSVPVQSNTFVFKEITIPVELGNGSVFPLHIQSSQEIPSSGLRWWLSDLGTDAASEWIWGYFNMACSIKDGYAARFETVTIK